jgi:Na+/H+ antiporter NhaD/arsenite permease-like protein
MDEGTTHAGPTRPGVFGWLAIVAGVAGLAWLIAYSLQHPAEHHALHDPPPWWGLGILPFIGVLGCIAILPLLPATHHWWESNLHRFGVSISFAGLTVLYYIIVPYEEQDVVTVLEHAIVVEYIPFIVLLFALYVISGGISLKGDLPARPTTNLGFLAVGAGIASFIGTTGASMLLIRPLLQTNAQRRHVRHTVIFFIFLVSNIGGCLLPIGDPPLFLGYLFGVPFFWTLGLWLPWLVCCGILLVIYYALDSLAYRREAPQALAADEKQREPLRLEGAINLLWLLGVVCSVAFVVPGKQFPLLGFEVFPFLRELLMLGFVAISLWRTPKAIRQYNNFNYVAILEVAALFIGIFITMQVPIAAQGHPAVQQLQLRGHPGGRGALHRHLHHHAGADRVSQRQGGGAGDERAMGVLLGDRVAFQLSRQCADLRRVLRDGQGAADRGRLRHRGADDGHEVRRRDRRAAARGDQPGRGVPRGDDLHRQRSEFHGQVDR